MRNLIWCEVKCLRCGRVAKLSGWYSPERIKQLKQETKIGLKMKIIVFFVLHVKNQLKL